MLLAPFGVLNDDQKGDLINGKTLFAPMPDWTDGEDKYKILLGEWLDDVKTSIWPAWEGGKWIGAAAKGMAANTKAELELAVNLYHGGGDKKGILAEIPDVPIPPDGVPRNQEWHYKIEDALVLDTRYLFVEGEEPSYDFLASKTIGSNYLVYDPTFPLDRFENLFWGKMDKVEPSSFAIKMLLQRPRPWTAAVGLGVDGFRYSVAGDFFATHTGVHPSLLSGHCIQGILGGCSVIEALLESGENISDETQKAIKQYMVDWGDRRVFAGVHYMTDNIGSWTLARRLIKHLFKKHQHVEAFAVEAITKHSRVFSDIIQHFPADSPARKMLLSDFPEGAPIS